MLASPATQLLIPGCDMPCSALLPLLLHPLPQRRGADSPGACRGAQAQRALAAVCVQEWGALRGPAPHPQVGADVAGGVLTWLGGRLGGWVGEGQSYAARCPAAAEGKPNGATAHHVPASPWLPALVCPGLRHRCRNSCYLFGRERRVADVPTDHPSCSKQHAVLQYRCAGRAGSSACQPVSTLC